jgi:hypothetical protein
MNNTSFNPSTQKGNSFPNNTPTKKNPLLQLAIDPTYTPLEEISQATSFILNTQCHVAALQTPAYYIRYVPSNTLNLHNRPYLFVTAFPSTIALQPRL